MIVEVSSGLDSPMNIPGNGVLKAWFNRDYANRAYPNFAGFGILTGGLLNLKLISALDLGVWKGGF